LTLTQRISNLRSAVACTSRRHTLTTVALVAGARRSVTVDASWIYH
jgi:hypothetical protein